MQFIFLLAQQIFAATRPGLPAGQGVVVEYRNLACSYAEPNPIDSSYRNLHPLCLLTPPMKWPLVSKTAFYFDTTQNRCIEGSAGLTSWCAAFLTKKACESKCVTPEFVPSMFAKREEISAFESSRVFLQCKPKEKARCNILLGRTHTCECELGTNSSVITIAPHTIEL
ncbi:hypothetical protein DSO57_1036784 [Entomophthora muscae]|uniref:Uncharacterized protein n=1 Tax=Entomophthora muscae TaxID=34485 RepID=A0ACC2UKT3_9FUNG|nr:hypothetical protein DSO57_1036784 [Entomophthora muscae]